MGLVDGPTEVHKVTIARQILKRYKAAPGLWPTEHLPAKRAAAQEKFAEHLEHEVGNQVARPSRTGPAGPARGPAWDRRSESDGRARGRGSGLSCS